MRPAGSFRAAVVRREFRDDMPGAAMYTAKIDGKDNRFVFGGAADAFKPFDRIDVSYGTHGGLSIVLES